MISSMYERDWADKETMDNEVSQVKGNVSPEMKWRCLAIFRYFVGTRDTSYSADIGRRLKMVELNTGGERAEEEDGSQMEKQEMTNAEIIFEIDVEKDMVNVLGTLHGACAAYIIDPCSVASLVALGIVRGIDGTGVSQSMNLIWHRPIHQGTKLRVVSTSVSLKGQIKTARCELWDKGSGSLCVSGVHSIVNRRNRPAALIDGSDSDVSTKL